MTAPMGFHTAGYSSSEFSRLIVTFPRLLTVLASPALVPFQGLFSSYYFPRSSPASLPWLFFSSLFHFSIELIINQIILTIKGLKPRHSHSSSQIVFRIPDAMVTVHLEGSGTRHLRSQQNPIQPFFPLMLLSLVPSSLFFTTVDIGECTFSL